MAKRVLLKQAAKRVDAGGCWATVGSAVGPAKEIDVFHLGALEISEKTSSASIFRKGKTTHKQRHELTNPLSRMLGKVRVKKCIRTLFTVHLLFHYIFIPSGDSSWELSPIELDTHSMCLPSKVPLVAAFLI